MKMAGRYGRFAERRKVIGGVVAEKKKRGNPKKPFIGPRLPDAGRGDLPNPRAPYCNKIYNEVRGKSSIPMYCGKQGLHLKHGKGKRTRWK